MSKVRLCERCRKEISSERLEAMPKTNLCIACSQEIGGEFEARAAAENTAKRHSLKKNYGAYNVRLVRKPIERLEKEEE